MSYKKPEIVCPAGTFSALKSAIKNGADAVYTGLNNQTNARNFPGLNFSQEELKQATSYAHKKNAKIYLAVNTYPEAGSEKVWKESIDIAANTGVDALILADIGLLKYACDNYPELRLHLSVQASASNYEAINFYKRHFNIKRAVLPRVLSLEDIADIIPETDVELEVFAFGGLCVMAEGRCALSAYATGISPNKNGVCSPASHVNFEYNSENECTICRLGEFDINRFAAGAPAAYPTLCKGLYKVKDTERGKNSKSGESTTQDLKEKYSLEEPVSLNAAKIVNEFADLGIAAIKIEGRQRSKSYVAEVVKCFRKIIDKPHKTEKYAAKLSKSAEGGKTTLGAYDNSWQ